jgi:RNA polymerase sigma-70 factor, ECF subfamily
VSRVVPAKGDARVLTPDFPETGESREAERARERTLVREAQSGSDDAFAALVRMHQRRAYGVARSIVLSHEDAEDAVQEAFLHAHRALGRFMPEQSFGAWLYRIVSNAALDLVRRRKVRETDELPETVALPFRDPGESGELRARLARALRKLQPRQRAVIVMHDVEGFTHGEIGDALGIPEGTARSDLHHARAALRGLLKDLWSDR